MTATTATEASVSAVLAESAVLDDPKIRAVNERHGDDHGVNLSTLRAIAKRLKTQHPLAVELWATDDTPAQLIALLICRPKSSPVMSWMLWCAKLGHQKFATG